VCPGLIGFNSHRPKSASDGISFHVTDLDLCEIFQLIVLLHSLSVCPSVCLSVTPCTVAVWLNDTPCRKVSEQVIITGALPGTRFYNSRVLNLRHDLMVNSNAKLKQNSCRKGDVDVVETQQWDTVR